MENNMRRMGIHVDIELCLRRAISVLEDRSTHNDQIFHGFTTRGSLRIAMAMFVSGPMGKMLISLGSARTRSIR